MSCPVCPLKLTYEVRHLAKRACGPCQRQIKQMMAGFHGVMSEPRPQKNTWDNTEAYELWKDQLTEADVKGVSLKKKDDYVMQRCDLRDMKRIVGFPKFPTLEDQVFTAWINEGRKDEVMQEVLGLTYSQLFHVKKVVRYRLQKQMLYYKQIQQLEKEKKVND